MGPNWMGHFLYTTNGRFAVSRIGRFPKRLGFCAFGGKNFEAKEVGRRAAKITGGRLIFIFRCGGSSGG